MSIKNIFIFKMIEIIKKYANDYKLGLNKRPPPWPDDNKDKIIQGITQNSNIDTSDPYFNSLFIEDFKNSQFEEDKDSSKNEIKQKEEKNKSEEVSLHK